MLRIILGCLMALSVAACNMAVPQNPAAASVQETQSLNASNAVMVGYIATQGGQLDIESIQHLPSRKQIVWMHQNLMMLRDRGLLVAGAKVRLIAYEQNGGPVIWENVSRTNGNHRVWMPKSIARQTGLFCLRVYGYRIANIENVQVRSDGATSWCQNDLDDSVDKSWMQGEQGGYGFPLILDKL